jgi:hypothetical protein
MFVLLTWQIMLTQRLWSTWNAYKYRTRSSSVTLVIVVKLKANYRIRTAAMLLLVLKYYDLNISFIFFEDVPMFPQDPTEVALCRSHRRSSNGANCTLQASASPSFPSPQNVWSRLVCSNIIAHLRVSDECSLLLNTAVYQTSGRIIT